MSHGGTESGASGDAGGDCPAIGVLEALLQAGSPAPSGPVASHLRSCSRCRDLLEEMREANEFLVRFRSRVGIEEASGDAPGGPDGGLIRLRGYAVERLITFGGQGAVYKARQRATKRDVAIKVPHGDTQRRPSIRFRFQREIELTSRLDHPGIVRVFGDCELEDGRLGCVMEFVEGETIEQWSSGERPRGRAGVRRIVEVMTAVADAIAYAHQRAVMHRDIKPSNVVVTPEGVPRVLDFGLAKSLDESGTIFNTMTGAFIGTLVYAAPEQVGGAKDASDLRTDVYALGLLLYQTLTGRLPFATDAPTADIVRSIRETAPARPTSLNPDIGPELDAIILKALAKEKERRFAAAAPLRDDLRRWLDGEPVRARFDSRLYVARKLAWRHRWAVALAAVAVCTLAVIVGLWLEGRADRGRAAVAAAVRDVRTLESHRVRMSEARSVARDSFVLGERVPWDALLEPDAILVREGIEGVSESGPVPTSPAYWALWEMYTRTPVVASVAAEPGGSIHFGGSPDQLIIRRGKQFEWWDWRRHVARRRVTSRHDADFKTFGYDEGGKALVFMADDRALVVVDTVRSESSQIGGNRRAGTTAVRYGRLVAHTYAPDEPDRFEVWDITVHPPRLLASHDRTSNGVRVRSIVFEPNGAHVATADEAGEIMIIEASTGRVVFDRPPTDEPRLDTITARRAGEFIASGPEMGCTILVSPDSNVTVGPTTHKKDVIGAIKLILPGVSSDRYLYATDRQQVGVGSPARPVTEGTLIPSVTATSGALSPDGRYAALLLGGSGRVGVLDLESAVARRLPFDAGVSPNGFATIFDVEFAADASALYAGAMDGSVRRFATARNGEDVVAVEGVEGGVSAIALDGERIVVGPHDLALRGANVSLVRPGREPAVIARADGWICAIVTEPGRAAWALTGRGQLLRIDLSGTGEVRHADISGGRAYPFRTLARAGDDGPLLAPSSSDGVQLVDPETLEPLGPASPPGLIRGIYGSPVDSDLVATGGDDGMIRLWRITHDEPPSLELIRAFGGHAGPIYALAFHPDGRLLASGGGAPEAKDLRIWDMQSGQELAALDLFEIGVFDIGFSPDGRWLAAGGEVRLGHPEEGGQLFLIDLHAADRSIAGNLEYHIDRFTREHGHEPREAEALRRWCRRVRASAESQP